jgi:hypothetical protein
MDRLERKFEDFILTEGLPYPWDSLERSLSVQEQFGDGARKCADFFNNHRNEFGPEELLLRLHSARLLEFKWQECLLFCLLDTGVSHFQTAKQALRLKNLRRLTMRIESGHKISKNEFLLMKELETKAAIKNTTDVLGCAYFARKLLALLIRKQYLHETHHWLLVFLIHSEVTAFRSRIDKISNTVDVYNMRKMARILPKVEVYDRNAKNAQDVAGEIEKNREVPRQTMTFEQNIEWRPFDEWISRLRAHKELEHYAVLFELQRKKRVPTSDLVALASLSRWVLESNGQVSDPFIWSTMALEMYDNGKFSIDAGKGLEKIRSFVQNAGAAIDGTTISGNFSDRLYSQWVGHDNLTRPFEPAAVSAEPLRFKDIVRIHINNEIIIGRLLDNPKVYSTPGLVEQIAAASRSVKVLSKIAIFNNLHCGAANQGVPRALLESPVNIPISLLRPFIRPSYFQIQELKQMIEGSATLRHEVFQEIRTYLAEQHG